MKSCGTCTRCCDGWMSDNIRGHEVYPGKPCFFVTIGRGCNDYDNRPNDPCKTFNCVWKVDNQIPEHMKPDISNIIATYNQIDGILYTTLTQAGNEVDKTSIDWYISFYGNKNTNLLLNLNNKSYLIGSDDFVKKISETINGASRYYSV